VQRIKSLLLAVLCVSCLLCSVAYAADEDMNALNIEDVEHFSAAIAQIHAYYIESVDSKQLLEDAMRGMLRGLDPHSDYLDEKVYEQLMSDTSGEFSGLGIEIVPENGVIKVVAPIDDTPAYKAGIQAGDYIVEINDERVSELTLQESVNMMRGRPGTTVKVTIVRQDKKKPFELTITREKIIIHSVKSQLLENGYAYVRVSQFQQPTADKIKKALKRLEGESDGPLKGVILDLRNNPGGLLHSAVHVSDLFLDSNKIAQHEQKIVYTKGRMDAKHFSAKATPGDILGGRPLIVLINTGSASASEIVAGALQDYKRAVLMGSGSFGKGSVQTVLPIGEKQAVKLTTALYYTPAGREIQAEGIEPDVLVEELKLVQDDEAIVMQPLKEFTYKSHLKGRKKKGEVADKKTVDKVAKKKAKIIEDPDKVTNEHAKKDVDNLAVDDYTLHQALILLKALNATNTQIVRSLHVP
jgi:carboxyl-terminal processing protease